MARRVTSAGARSNIPHESSPPAAWRAGCAVRCRSVHVVGDAGESTGDIRWRTIPESGKHPDRDTASLAHRRRRVAADGDDQTARRAHDRADRGARARLAPAGAWGFEAASP